MPKITTNNAGGLLVKYAVKIVISSVLSILVLNSLCSFVVLKFDIDLAVLQYAGTAICVISALIITFISLSGFKNNFLILSMISVLPLLIYTIVNFCINKTDAVFIIIKIAGIVICAFVVSILKSSKKSR
ncbi:MAG: hypothetical protein K2J35_04450 [Eubacterium sp.]|nr:hypothetical protein [Eubacterium sp.]